MKNLRKQILCGFLSLSALLIIPVLQLNAGTIVLPGDMGCLNRYMGFNLAEPEEHFIFYLNETLLFDNQPHSSESIKKRILNSTNSGDFRRGYGLMQKWTARVLTKQNAEKRRLAARMNYILQWHHKVNEYVDNINNIKAARTGSASEEDTNGAVSFDLDNGKEYKNASKLFELMGLVLAKDSNGDFRVSTRAESMGGEFNHYYLLAGMYPWQLQEKLNENRRFEFTRKECRAAFPWDMDFFNSVTGLYLENPVDFLQELLINKKLQMLLGILFRLPDREINFISNIEPGYKTWKDVYLNDELLNGLFVLSHALRVKDNRLMLPGGTTATDFWATMTGHHPFENPAGFLRKLAVQDQGKLNFFYVFGLFLTDEGQKIFFRGFDTSRFRPIYDNIHLQTEEKIRGLEIPALRDFGFFSLMHALKIRKGEIQFPGGVESWAAAIGSTEKTLQGLLENLALKPPDSESMRSFISIYSKFHDRSELINEDVLRVLYENYREYNVVVDFIEKIPLKKTETALKLMAWIKDLDKAKIKEKDRESRIAVSQAILELMAVGAGTMPVGIDYDRLVDHLVKIPVDGHSARFYDGIFQFIGNHLGVDMSLSRVNESFLDFVLTGVADRQLRFQYQLFTLNSKQVLRKEIADILESQHVFPLSQMVTANRLLAVYRDSSPDSTGNTVIESRLSNIFHQLPRPIMEDTVPLKVRKLIRGYSHADVHQQLDRLIRLKQDGGSQDKITSLVDDIKANCLLVELKHFLVTSAYAANAKTSHLRLFLNPNLTRFHDFGIGKGRGPWNHSGILLNHGSVRLYHLTGGLSRLNISLASPIGECLLKKSIGYYAPQIAPLIYNNLDLYPNPCIGRSRDYIALLVDFARELLQKSGSDSSMRNVLTERLGRATAGYHYRNAVNRILSQNDNPKSVNSENIAAPQDYDLYYSELLRLGEQCFSERLLLDKFSKGEALNLYSNPLVHEVVEEEMDRFGSVYYHTFGGLKARYYKLFPQSLSHLFGREWGGGEMNNDLKIKLAYLSYFKRIPPPLLGHLVFEYFRSGLHYLRYAYDNDFHKAYLFFHAFNNLYMDHILTRLKLEGTLVIN